MNRHTVSSFVLLVALTGCRGSSGSLVSLDAIDPGEDCEFGGTAVNTGVDADKDGALSSEEIEETVTICNGAPGEDGQDGSDGSDGATGGDGAAGDDGVPVLFRSTEIDGTDSDCAGGGTRLEFGLDNGDGGETAGDGILGDGEVDQSEDICDGEPALAGDSYDEPGGAAGTGTISAGGGNGNDGGPGGYVSIGTSSANSGNVKVFTTGAVDASFNVPTLAPDMSDAVVVSTDTFVPAFSSASQASGLADGDLFLTNDSAWHLHRYLASGDSEIVDALHIEAGATLTLDADIGDPDLGIDRLVVDGTLTLTEGRGIDLSGEYLHVGASGMIDTSSASGAPGSVTLRFDVSILEGTIDASATQNGFDGGHVILVGFYGVYATGQIITFGADSSESGGFGGQVNIHVTDGGPLYNSAMIDAHGGDGTSGGWGGSVDMSCIGGCVVRQAGEIDASGGDGTVGGGGGGGTIEVSSYYEALITSGDLRAGGGDSVDGDGGEGGSIRLWAAGEGGDVGHIDISGELDVAGGNATNGAGGQGGTLDVDHRTPADGLEPVALYGYATIDVSGGDGTGGGGGFGGEMNLSHPEGEDGFEPGGIANYAAIDASGGDGSTGEAGYGGSVYIGCGEANAGDPCFVRNHGAIDVSVGLGGGESGGGEVGFDASSWIEVQGDIDLSAPDSSDTESGDGGSLSVYSYGSLVWEGDILGSGGASSATGGDGGDGGELEIWAQSIEYTGDVQCAGGDGDTDGGSGGAGGWVGLQSFGSSTSFTSSGSTVAPGSGEFEGEDGEFFIDGLDVAGSL